MLKVTLSFASCACSLSAINQDRYDLPDSGSHPQTINLRALEKQERELRIAREKRDLQTDAATLAALTKPNGKVKPKKPEDEESEEEAPDSEKEDGEEEEEELSDDM